MDFFGVFVIILYIATIVVAYYHFSKWVKEFSGKDELSTGVWVVVILAAASTPSVIVNCLGLLVSIIAQVVLFF
jgi:uncharacterized membrane protein YidH (DUF202 family)